MYIYIYIYIGGTHPRIYSNTHTSTGVHIHTCRQRNISIIYYIKFFYYINYVRMSKHHKVVK